MKEKIPFKKYIFPTLIALSAISVSISAAFYSISGLSQLFAGAAIAVIIMASALEASKLVMASLLYQYRKTLPKLLKFYLTIATVVLIIITSMGIYGFLSASYETVSTKYSLIENQIEIIENRKIQSQEQLTLLNEERTSSSQAMNELRTGLASNVIQYVDPNTGQLITTTSAATRRSLESQLEQITLRNQEINNRIDLLTNEIFEYDSEIHQIKQESELSAELGPLRYISKITGGSMDYIVNILILIIIFVFDPLAVSLVIAANFAFAQMRGSPLKPKELILPKPKEDQLDETPVETDTKKNLEVASPELKEVQLNETPVEIDTKISSPPPPSKEQKKPKKPKEVRFMNFLTNPNLSTWKKSKIKKQQNKEDNDLVKTY